MPDFRGDAAGLPTRIAVEPSARSPARFGVDLGGGVVAEAIAIDTDLPRWRRAFEALWPDGSAAHVSCFDRLVRGPDDAATDAVRPLE